MAYTETLFELLPHELNQREEEGCETSACRERFRELEKLRGAEQRCQAEELYNTLDALEVRADFAYKEPSTFPEILALRPNSASQHTQPRPIPPSDVLLDHLEGAWLGRTAGCILGKPVEGVQGDGRAAIRRYLEGLDAWPLSDYVPWDKEPPEPSFLPQDWLNMRSCCRGHVVQGERDDDLDYTILTLHMLEAFGERLTASNVAETWLQRLPYHMVYTAERIAYRNLVQNIEPPATATVRNPYREWIGAQIRADGFGYAYPGDPERAAQLAFADASLSHIKNGIYGEMWVAAMTAQALVSESQDIQEMDKILDAGLAQIPENCRLAEAVRNVRKWAEQNPDWEAVMDRIQADYGHYHPVHTINNAAVVTLALCCGQLDYEKTICIAVMCGWDTDCNGATAGSIAGALLGTSGLPAKWITPLNSVLKSAVYGFETNRIGDLAKRTLCLAEGLAGR